MKITSDHQIDVAKQIFSPNHSEQKFHPKLSLYTALVYLKAIW